MKRRIAALIGLILVGLLIYLAIAGSAVVVDETGDVLSAVVTNDRQQQRLTHIWGGYFYAIPRLEGTIEVRCRSGSRNRWGYVTGNMHTKIRVVGRDCSKIIHA